MTDAGERMRAIVREPSCPSPSDRASGGNTEDAERQTVKKRLNVETAESAEWLDLDCFGSAAAESLRALSGLCVQVAFVTS
jgi:hypothetical protein